jgi:hypothetical protein
MYYDGAGITVNSSTSARSRTARRDSELERLRAALAAAEHDNAELLIEIGRLRASLQEALDHQTATFEVLQIIANSFVACALAIVEPPAGARRRPRLRLVNAGQPPVLLFRAGAVVEMEPPGERFPLGAVADVDYHELTELLQPGDVVVFSSDGLGEAPARAISPTLGAPVAPLGQAGELLGFERLAQLAAHWAQHGTSAEAIAEGIWADLTARCGDASHHDDMTLLVLRVPD